MYKYSERKFDNNSINKDTLVQQIVKMDVQGAYGMHLQSQLQQQQKHESEVETCF
jgi:hypothetical protein